MPTAFNILRAAVPVREPVAPHSTTNVVTFHGRRKQKRKKVLAAIRDNSFKSVTRRGKWNDRTCLVTTYIYCSKHSSNVAACTMTSSLYVFMNMELVYVIQWSVATASLDMGVMGVIYPQPWAL